jgi:hypothetical protein
MKRLTTIVWLFIAIIAGLSLLGGTLVKLSAQESKKPPQVLPVLDYETELQSIKATASEKSKKTRARFNSRSDWMIEYRRISEMPQKAVPLPTNLHWWHGLSALPVAQSDVIVAGKVVDAQAHLSDDRTGIYSEYSVGVDNIFKNTGDAIGRTITGTRSGGAVRFASGKVQEYTIAYQGVPTKGKSYVLFLKREEAGDFTILTGYELSNGLVTPLDGEEGINLTFAQYKDATESQFMQDLRAAIQRGGDK